MLVHPSEGRYRVDSLKKALIVGSGGREHALVKALLRSNEPLCLYSYPGNPGMEDDGCMLIGAEVTTWEELANWASAHEISLTIVGPEVPLVEGIVDLFRSRGLPIFGPTAAAARIEGSKAFSKELMKRYGIPTAAFELFGDHESARAWVEEHGAPVVVKADGLAAGKGAIVCNTQQEALAALARIFDDREFGEAGASVVLEEKLYGEEASVFVLADGATYRILPVSQDHKAVGEGDCGPNTGGMGAYAPAPVVDAQLLNEIESTIVVPVLRAMSEEGCPYTGLLYCGIMVTDAGPQVIEFNCRFGDPETQAVLPLVECNWYDVLHAASCGRLAATSWSILPGACVAVVLAARGYPGPYAKGAVLHGITEAQRGREGLDVCHAGTARGANGELVTAGGRVLAVCSRGATLEEAIAKAYEAAAEITFDGVFCRKDIGAKGLARQKR